MIDEKELEAFLTELTHRKTPDMLSIHIKNDGRNRHEKRANTATVRKVLRRVKRRKKKK